MKNRSPEFTGRLPRLLQRLQHFAAGHWPVTHLTRQEANDVLDSLSNAGAEGLIAAVAERDTRIEQQTKENQNLQIELAQEREVSYSAGIRVSQLLWEKKQIWGKDAADEIERLRTAEVA